MDSYSTTEREEFSARPRGVRDWRRSGPTLTAENASERKERLGSSLLPIYTVEDITDEEFPSLNSEFRIEDSDRGFRIVRSVGPLNADSYLVAMRRLDGRWFVRRMMMEWVS